VLPCRDFFFRGRVVFVQFFVTSHLTMSALREELAQSLHLQDPQVINDGE
jgi:UTP:GlnB (protein PII) uridylyltransferase